MKPSRTYDSQERYRKYVQEKAPKGTTCFTFPGQRRLYLKETKILSWCEVGGFFGAITEDFGFRSLSKIFFEKRINSEGDDVTDFPEKHPPEDKIILHYL